MIITNAQVFIDGQFHDVDVQYDENKIINIGRNLTENVADKDIIDAKGNYLFAGFIETHQHGGFRKTFTAMNIQKMLKTSMVWMM